MLYGYRRHGLSGTRVHHIWRQMLYRCSNPNAPEYRNYGGRGIRVCHRWQTFNFFLEDMGVPPTDKHTLERKNNSRGYTPKNCEWATYKVQHNNRRDNRKVTAFGRTQNLTQWAEEYKLPVSTLKNRLFRARMSPEAALLAKPYAQQRGQF